MADRLERLTNLLALLLATEQPLTLDHIANELAGQYPEANVSRRGAFERDKALLRAEGIPVETVAFAADRGGGIGYRIDRRAFELPDLGLTPEEVRAVQLAVAAVHLDLGATDEALWKLSSTAPSVAAGGDDGGGLDEDQGAVVDLPPVAGLAALFEAAAARADTTFSYRGEPRVLDPYGLLARDGFWYVVGRDHRSDELRTFRVDRIDGGSVTVGEPAAFERPVGFDARVAVPDDPKVIGHGAARDALVRVAPLRALAVVAEVGDAAVVERGRDGSVVVRVACTNGPAFRSWVLGFLEHAEVLAPDDVRADVIAWLRAIADRRAS